MRLYLIEKKSIFPEHVDKIVSYIYDEPRLSRICHSDLIEVFHKSQFKILEVLQRYGTKPDHKTLNKLKNIFRNKQHNFEVNGMQFL